MCLVDPTAAADAGTAERFGAGAVAAEGGVTEGAISIPVDRRPAPFFGCNAAVAVAVATAAATALRFSPRAETISAISSHGAWSDGRDAMASPLAARRGRAAIAATAATAVVATAIAGGFDHLVRYLRRRAEYTDVQFFLRRCRGSDGKVQSHRVRLFLFHLGPNSLEQKVGKFGLGSGVGGSFGFLSTRRGVG